MIIVEGSKRNIELRLRKFWGILLCIEIWGKQPERKDPHGKTKTCGALWKTQMFRNWLKPPQKYTTQFSNALEGRCRLGQGENTTPRETQGRKQYFQLGAGGSGWLVNEKYWKSSNFKTKKLDIWKEMKRVWKEIHKIASEGQIHVIDFQPAICETSYLIACGNACNCLPNACPFAVQVHVPRCEEVCAGIKTTIDEDC